MNSTILKKKTKQLGRTLYKTDEISEFAESLFYLLTPYMIYKGYTFLLELQYPKETPEDTILRINFNVALKNKNGVEVSKILQELKSKDPKKYNVYWQKALSYEIEQFRKTETTFIQEDVNKKGEKVEVKKTMYPGKDFSLPTDKKTRDMFINIYQNVNIDCRIDQSKCRKYGLQIHPDKIQNDPDAFLKFQLLGQIQEILYTVYKK
jgi:curved DNA-binding protein CbpA